MSKPAFTKDFQHKACEFKLSNLTLKFVMVPNISLGEQYHQLYW